MKRFEGVCNFLTEIADLLIIENGVPKECVYLKNMANQKDYGTITSEKELGYGELI